MSWLGFDGRSQPGNQITGAINSNARMESELGLVSPEKGLQIQYYELLQMPPNIHFSLLNTLIDFFLSYISMFVFFLDGPISGSISLVGALLVAEWLRFRLPRQETWA